MSILGTQTEYEEQDQIYFWPAVLNEEEEVSLTKAIFMSAFIHVAGTALLLIATAIILFILQFLVPNLNLFQKPEMKPKDIEFVLVNHEAKPINPHTKFRADRNSRSGGKRVSKKITAAPTPHTRKSAPQKKASHAKSMKQQLNKILKKQEQHQEHPQKNSGAKHQAAKTKSQSNNMAPPRPAPHVSMPKPAVPNLFSVPVPKNNLPKTKTGGGGGSKSANPLGTRSGSGSGHRGSSPSPVMASGGGASAGRGRHSSPYSAGSGSVGTPGGGGGAPGIDAIAEPDFGPYMRDLQAKIKRNWDPPKSEQSKRVVLLFTIAKDGRLLHVRVYRSSGSATADKAAMSAVQYSAPFKPLPREYRGSDIDIHFTFDYNVFGGSIR
jgi:TonB family protein